MNKNPFQLFQGSSQQDLPPYEQTEKRIAQLVESSDIFIFMKGSPDFPQCGFSANTVGIFNQLGRPYKTFNVLSDLSVREGVKKYSNWPTIPQIYIKNEFIGGNDIITEMHESGELEKMLEEKLGPA